VRNNKSITKGKAGINIKGTSTIFYPWACCGFICQSSLAKYIDKTKSWKNGSDSFSSRKQGNSDQIDDQSECRINFQSVARRQLEVRYPTHM